MTLLIGMDIGTTTIKAVALDSGMGRLVAAASRPTPVTHPRSGWSEHDPELLWQAAAACLSKVSEGLAGRQIGALAIASFAEAGLPLGAGDTPLYPIMAWYDRRCQAEAAWIDRQMPAAALHSITGQRVSTSFGAVKWLWLCRHEPEVAAQTVRWLSVPDYLLLRLTGETGTDFSLASRTLLLDQHTLRWSGAMLKLVGLDADCLPQTAPSGTVVGRVTKAAASITGIPSGTACVLGGHDHLCAALAAGAVEPGAVVDSSGTAEALVAVLPRFHSSPPVAAAGYACYAHVVPGAYVFKGGLKAAGGSVEWLARRFAGTLPGDENGEVPYDELTATAASGLGNRAGPV